MSDNPSPDTLRRVPNPRRHYGARKVTMSDPRPTDEHLRQLALAKRIGAEFCDCDNLIPLGSHSSFSVSSMSWDMWYDERICDLAWWAVGKQIEAHAGQAHVIDHAWVIGFGGKPHEPWALVTEPYIADDAATAIIHLANDAMAEWSVRVHLLPAVDSSWNPGQCRPIVATFNKGCVGSFMRTAVTWAIEALHP